MLVTTRMTGYSSRVAHLRSIPCGLLIAGLAIATSSGCTAWKDAQHASQVREASAALDEGKRSMHLEKGRIELLKAATLFEQAELSADQARSLYWLAVSRNSAGQLREAADALQLARQVYDQEAGFYSPRAAQLMLGQILTKMKKERAARKEFNTIVRWAAEPPQYFYLRTSLVGLAQLDAEGGDLPRARQRLARALALANEAKKAYGPPKVHYAWGNIELASGNPQIAREHYQTASDDYGRTLKLLRDRADVDNRQMHLGQLREARAEVLLSLAKLDLNAKRLGSTTQLAEEGWELMLLLLSPASKQEKSLSLNRRRKLSEQLHELYSSTSATLVQQWGVDSIASHKAMSGEVRRAADGSTEIGAPVWKQVFRTPELLKFACRLVPELKDGRRIGMRTFGVRDTTFYGALGLKNGDRLVSLQGVSLSDHASVMKRWPQWKNLREFTLEFDRKEVRHSLRLRLLPGSLRNDKVATH